MYNPLDLSMLHRLRWLEYARAQTSTEELRIGSDAGNLQGEFWGLVGAARDGEHFYVEKNFQDLVAFAEQDIPESVEFDMSWLLANHGWLELSVPIHNPDGVERPIIGWCPVQIADGLKNPNDFREEDFVDGFSFFFLPRSPLDFDPHNGALVVVVGAIQGQTLAHCGLQETKFGGSRKALYCTRFAYTLMHMMSQRIAVPTPAQARHNIRNQAIAKRMAAAARPQIVMLRRAAEEYRHEMDGSPHEYSCQWVVRGHWRQQPYRSIHQTRPIFIEAYVKGPADKPMKTPVAKIFVAAR
jgi:hypothetical protein